MKFFLLLLSLFLTACRTPRSAPLPALPTKSAPEPRAIASAPPPTPDPKLQEQAQLIDALISQNDALTAQIATLATSSRTPAATPTPEPIPPTTAPAEIHPPPAAPAVPPAAPTSDPSLLVPNADGVIDLAAVALAQSSSEPINPFAVRSVPADRVREVTLRIAGLVGGERPCAVVNDRRVQAGDHIESLAVERIEPDAVVFTYGEHRLRLPVAESPTRVRLPL